MAFFEFEGRDIDFFHAQLPFAFRLFLSFPLAHRQ